MSVRIGHSSINEYGTVSGGVSGDQTGKEVCIRDWYSKPWDYMAIHPDPDVREKHAACCEAACNNDNIGYCQGKRNTLHPLAVATNFDYSAIATKCDCDCSSLQNSLAVASGAANVSYGSNGWTTSTMKANLQKAGYKIITSSTYLKSAAYCVRGAIYVKAGSHTVCGLDNGASYKATLEAAGLSTTTTATSDGSYDAGTEVTLSGTPIYSTATATSPASTKSGKYYVWDAAARNGRIRITNKKTNVGVSGQVTGWVAVADVSANVFNTTTSASGSITTLQATSQEKEAGCGAGVRYKTTASLNLRYGPSAAKVNGVDKYGVIAVLPASSTVIYYGYYDLDENGVKWLLVTNSGHTGWVSSAYLKLA